MDAERHARVVELFLRVCDLDSDERAAVLSEACGDDEPLLREVLSLLQHDHPGHVDIGAAGVSSGAVHVHPELALPRSLGRFTLLRRLGHGGMGVVYEAHDAVLGRLVALKSIKQELDGEQVLARFEVERQALALMNHPNVAAVLDAGSDDQGRPYFVMELLRGTPLTEYCDRAGLGTRRRLELFLEVCDGVHHAHQKGIIHRDLKPGNILVEDHDGTPVPKIIDFGVAKAINRALTERVLFTEFGQMVGTPEYMSPEQADLSPRDVDTRSDVYSLGVILYELLVGVPPLEPRQLREGGYEGMKRQILHVTPPKPSTRINTLGESAPEVARRRSADLRELLRECRGDLDWITMKALEKDRERRYASVSELAADVQRHLENRPVSAGPPSVSYLAAKFVRRHRAAVGFATLLLLSLLAGLAGTTYGYVRAVRAERQAVLEAETVRQVRDFLTGLFAINDPGESRGRAITVKEVLDRGAQRIQGELAGRPELQGRLLETMGVAYRDLGLYEDALPLLRASVEAAERTGPAGLVEAAHARMRLGGLLVKKGRYDEAIPVLRDALAVLEASPPGGPDLPATLNNLGNAYRGLGRNEEALPFLDRAVAVLEADPARDDLDLARKLGNRGSTRLRLGDDAGAEDDFARSLAIRRARLPQLDPDIAGTLDNLAALHYGRKDWDAAERASREALLIEETSLGKDHPELVNTLLNLGKIARQRGYLEQSLRHLERACAIAEARLDPAGRDAKAARAELDKTRAELGIPRPR